MARLLRYNLLVFIAALFAANIAYQVLLFWTLNALMRATQHGDAIPWFGRVVTFPPELRTFAMFGLPLLLTLTATLVLIARHPEKPGWHRAVALIAAVVIPYVALVAYMIGSVATCVAAHEKVCML